MTQFRIQVNNRHRTVNVERDTPLLWVLRDELGLVGTKFGCGIAQCGACTVHIHGKAVRACMMPISAVGERAITTIEGLSEGRGLHALQRQWIEQDVAQCGYCQSGQIMTAAALLAVNAQPTDEDINQAVAGNYCRCGTYNRIRSAIHSAARDMKDEE